MQPVKTYTPLQARLHLLLSGQEFTALGSFLKIWSNIAWWEPSPPSGGMLPLAKPCS